MSRPARKSPAWRAPSLVPPARPKAQTPRKGRQLKEQVVRPTDSPTRSAVLQLSPESASGVMGGRGSGDGCAARSGAGASSRVAGHRGGGLGPRCSGSLGASREAPRPPARGACPRGPPPPPCRPMAQETKGEAERRRSHAVLLEPLERSAKMRRRHRVAPNAIHARRGATGERLEGCGLLSRPGATRAARCRRSTGRRATRCRSGIVVGGHDLSAVEPWRRLCA